MPPGRHHIATTARRTALERKGGWKIKKKKRKEKERRPESDDGRKRGEIVGTRGNSVANRT